MTERRKLEHMIAASELAGEVSRLRAENEALRKDAREAVERELRELYAWCWGSWSAELKGEIDRRLARLGEGKA
jgi:hypothetical protein